ncbi:unnamed protein product [Caenorhabditis brenneri]
MSGNRTPQPWRQNGGVRLGGSGRREQGVYRPPPQRGETAAVTSSGQRERRSSEAQRAWTQLYAPRPPTPSRCQTGESRGHPTVAATPRRKNAPHPAQDDDEVPVASHAPPVVSAPAPPRAVPSSGQGMAHPYVQMDEATMDQSRGFLHQLFLPAPAPMWPLNQEQSRSHSSRHQLHPLICLLLRELLPFPSSTQTRCPTRHHHLELSLSSNLIVF